MLPMPIFTQELPQMYWMNANLYRYWQENWVQSIVALQSSISIPIIIIKIFNSKIPFLLAVMLCKRSKFLQASLP